MQDILSALRPNLFAGKTVVVSGGTSGIGLALAQGFAKLGASVIATGSSPNRLNAAKAGHADIRFEKLDVRDTEAVNLFFAALPSLDVLINAQGIARPGAEWTEETYLDVIDVNMNSAMRLSMAAHPLLVIESGLGRNEVDAQADAL